jgi:hypothetical protein
MACTNFFHTFDEADYAPSYIPIDHRKKGESFMLIATATVVGTNLYDFLIKILGSEVMRTLFSYLIRQALIRIGL